MNTIQEFINFIEGLDDPNIELYEQGHIARSIQPKIPPNTPFHSINLKILTKDIINYNSLQSWLKNKSLTDHLQNNIIKAILKINPPESVRNELLSIML
jgi:hypothetical protein